MPRYNKKNTKELKEYLYNSCVHDATLESIRYNCENDTIKIQLYNQLFDVKINLTFHNIGIVIAVRGEWPGNRTTLISLTVEEDYSYFQNSNLKNCECVEDSLYMLFQLLSGDELHIVSKEAIIETVS